MTQLATAKKRQIQCLRKLEDLKHELDQVDLERQLQKELVTRHIKLTVASLQQAILARGKELARQLNGIIEERGVEIKRCKTELDEAITKCVSNLSTLHRYKDEAEFEAADNEDEHGSYELKLPPPPPVFTLDEKSVLKAVHDLQLSVNIEGAGPRDKEELCTLPTFHIKEGDSMDTVCTDLWWASKQCFSLLPAVESLPAELNKLSASVRRLYMETVDWCCYDQSEPEAGALVYVRLPSNSQWCRGTVISNKINLSLSDVHLLDWGQTVTDVSWGHLLPDRPDVCSAPPLAVECVFEEDVGSNKSRDARWYFNDIIQKFSSSCIPLKATFLNQVEIGGRQAWRVDLRGTQPDGTLVDISATVRQKFADAGKKSAIECRDIRTEFAATRTVVNEGGMSESTQPDENNMSAKIMEQTEPKMEKSLTEPREVQGGKSHTALSASNESERGLVNGAEPAPLNSSDLAPANQNDSDKQPANEIAPCDDVSANQIEAQPSHDVSANDDEFYDCITTSEMKTNNTNTNMLPTNMTAISGNANDLIGDEPQEINTDENLPSGVSYVPPALEK